MSGPNLFSTVELEFGSGMPPRTLQFLKREGVAPAPVRDAVRGGRPLWGSDAMSRLAAAGALYNSNIGQLPAARLATVLIDAIEKRRGKNLSGVDRIRHAAAVLAGVGLNENNEFDQFEAIGCLLKHRDLYTPGAALPEDVRVRIVDRRYVFFVYPIKLVSPVDGKPTDSEPAFLIEGWERSSSDADIVVSPIETLFAKGWEITGSLESKAALLVEAQWKAAAENAVSKLEINLSLAIRSAFERIHAHREGGDAA